MHGNMLICSKVRSHAKELDIDRDSISIGGLSAGCHMTAVMSHLARDEGISLKLALMVVLSVDLRLTIAEEPMRSEIANWYPSVEKMGFNPCSPKSRMDWFMDYWMPKCRESRVHHSQTVLWDADDHSK